MSINTTGKRQHSQPITTFGVVQKKIPCNHNFQLYVDYGATVSGPWLKVAVNDTEFGVGYLPKANPTKLKVVAQAAS